MLHFGEQNELQFFGKTILSLCINKHITVVLKNCQLYKVKDFLDENILAALDKIRFCIYE